MRNGLRFHRPCQIRTRDYVMEAQNNPINGSTMQWITSPTEFIMYFCYSKSIKFIHSNGHH